MLHVRLMRTLRRKLIGNWSRHVRLQYLLNSRWNGFLYRKGGWYLTAHEQ